MTQPERWKAPAEDGAILTDPPLERVGHILETNRRRLASARLRLQGKSLADIRTAAAERILRLSPQGPSIDFGSPFIVTGHQPELFHPGVWVKNFALNGIARRHGLNPLNLIVDCDTVKTTSLHIPEFNSNPSRVHRHLVPFDSWDGEEPYIFRTIHDPNLFRTFPERSRPFVGDWGFEPMLDGFWNLLIDEQLKSAAVKNIGEPNARLGELFASARRTIEAEWGCRNAELPFSSVCCIPEMVGHLLSDMPRFQAVYNQCLADYRRRHRLRSNRHPAPNLEVDEERYEAPFWWLDQSAHNRHRVFVQNSGDKITLFAGRRGKPFVVSKDEPKLFEILAESGVLLVTRALMTTLFARLCIADVFIHGIGGAKYDEVTDNIVRRYFDVEPPDYLVVTGTLRLPFQKFAATSADHLKRLRQFRELRWNPERFAPSAEPGTRELVVEKKRWLAQQPSTRAGRRNRYRELLRLTEALRPALASQISEMEQSIDRSERELRANEVLSRRDYAFPLYPKDLLQEFCTRLL